MIDIARLKLLAGNDLVESTLPILNPDSTHNETFTKIATNVEKSLVNLLKKAEKDSLVAVAEFLLMYLNELIKDFPMIGDYAREVAAKVENDLTISKSTKDTLIKYFGKVGC